MTMTLVSTVTVGSGGAASIDFTSIPQTGTDLLVVYSLRSTSGDNNVQMSFNSSTTSFTNKVLYGNGSTVSSGSNYAKAGYMPYSTDTSNTFGNNSIYVPNYTSSTNKSYSLETVTENNATSVAMALLAGLWSNTSAITSLSLIANSGSFAQYSTASLYTITKGSGGATVS